MEWTTESVLRTLSAAAHVERWAARDNSVNKPHTLFHLGEALEELKRTIADLKKKRGYDEVELQVAMEHLYHHLNTAWNARHVSSARAWKAAARDFRTWRKFPKDLFRD